MGEARRRVNQGLSPRKKKDPGGVKKVSPRIFSWLPITEQQEQLFIQLTIRGTWIGI